jgi:hypothetical protein
LSPRVSAKYFLTRDFALTAATGSYAQWLHSLGEDDIPIQPLQFWIASDKTIPVSRSWQSSIGAEMWTSATRQFRIEAFYKKYSNLVETNPTADPNLGDSPVIELGGTSHGADLLIRQLDNGRFGGWIAYSYTVSERVTPQGVVFSPSQDRRHELNAVGTWKFDRYRIGARLGLATGTPYTPIVGTFTRERYDPATNSFAPDFGDGNLQYISGATNSARLPFAHRLDISITRVGGGNRVQVSPYLSIANVYGANNPAAYAFDYGQTTVVTTTGQNGVVTKTVVPTPERVSIPNLPFLPTFGVHIAY